MKLCLLPLFCLYFASLSSGAAETPIPWKEITVYSQGEGKHAGSLVSCRAWTPDSPDYVAYSIYYDQDGTRDNFVNLKWRDAFAAGFYAYRRIQDPVHPFERVVLPSPPHFVRMMLGFPREEGWGNNGGRKDDCGHVVPLESDHYHTYWRSVSRMMAMAQQQGHIYFFPDREGEEKIVHWDGEKEFLVGDVMPFPDRSGLVNVSVRKKGNDRFDGRVAINPETGKSFRLDEKAVITRSREDPAYISDTLSLNKGCSRYSDEFTFFRGDDDSPVASGCYNGLGDDCFSIDGKVWCSRGDNAVLLYPEPWEDVKAPLAVTLSSDGSPEEGKLNLQIKFTNRGNTPIVLPEGWGTVILRFSGTETHAHNYLAEAALHTDSVISDGGEEFPALTLNRGQSVTAWIFFEAGDWRVFPREKEVYIKATFSTAGPPGTPGHGMYTSPSLKAPGFIPPRN